MHTRPNIGERVHRRVGQTMWDGGYERPLCGVGQTSSQRRVVAWSRKLTVHDDAVTCPHCKRAMLRRKQTGA